MTGRGDERERRRVGLLAGGGLFPIEFARAARMSLHWAKLDRGGGWVLFDPQRSARYAARYTLSAEMPGALARGEFTLVYQPLVDLGDGSGLELMRHVRSRGDTPGIAVSGYATEDDVQQSREAGFALHLAKPVTFATLESAIRQVTDARSSFPQP